MPAHSHAENRLAKESSPYLLQHARNPVDWYPWGTEAFAEARRRNVPIFLSVGYSTCYWCHVMERESFEDAATGALMSERFVCIKVDREERPDVDDIYMTAVQLLTRRGGWPMSVWLTPPGARGADDRGLEPFYAGTYFPDEPRHGMPAFTDVLRNISDAWSQRRADVLEQAARVTQAVREQAARDAEPVAIGPEHVGEAVGTLLRIHDGTMGGFGGAPKFPQPVYLDFLLDAIPAIDDPAVRQAAARALRLTLDAMALGGMYDQVGGGFHRYSTDEKWLVPHFEKMLYDNGALASVYARSYAQSRDPFDAWVLSRTLDYALREMADAPGGFFSAQDAEVNHREGQNYLWTDDQLIETLGAEDGAWASRLFGVDQGTNFRDPHHPGDAPANVLFLRARPEALAREQGMERVEFEKKFAEVSARLLVARGRRDQPGTDDKVLASWNGLMIAGLADGAAALCEHRYFDAASKAADFVLTSMRDDGGGLFRVWRAGTAKTPAFLEDYAMLAHGLIALHRAALTLGLDPRDRLEQAGELMERARAEFEDPVRPGLFYDTRSGQSDLIVRTGSAYDGAMASGPSVMLHNLISMYELTGERASLEQSARMLAALSPSIRESPVGSIQSTRGLLRLLRLDARLVESSLPARMDEEDIVRAADTPVQIFTNAERAVVKRGEAVELMLEIRIEPGYHITAHKPGIEGLTPLQIEIRGGGGVRARVEYPLGKAYEGEALPTEDRGRMMVHAGNFRLKVVLERTEDAWSGRPLLTVTYQACDDRACFQPMTVELDVALDPG